MRQPRMVRSHEVTMTVTKQQAGEIVTLFVEGRVDTNTSPPAAERNFGGVPNGKGADIGLGEGGLRQQCRPAGPADRAEDCGV